MVKVEGLAHKFASTFNIVSKLVTVALLSSTTTRTPEQNSNFTQIFKRHKQSH